MTGTDSDGQVATYTTQITITAGYTPPGVRRGTLTWIIIAGAVIEVVGIAIVVLFFLRRRKRNTAKP
jgi:LPXTG-motif cell wall-anchored protein